MRTIELTTRFKRDYRRVSKGQHAATLDASLRPVFDALVHDRPLDPRYRDHPLQLPSRLRPPGCWRQGRLHFEVGAEAQRWESSMHDEAGDRLMGGRATLGWQARPADAVGAHRGAV